MEAVYDLISGYAFGVGGLAVGSCAGRFRVHEVTSVGGDSGETESAGVGLMVGDGYRCAGM